MSEIGRRFYFVPRYGFTDAMSSYLPGMRYTVHPGNDVLRQKVMAWQGEGMVDVLSTDPRRSTITGTMRVS